MPYPKYRRFLVKELETDDFIARQLRDTAYIGKLAVEYLRMLVGEANVIASKGQLTAELRWQWGLGTILSELPDSPAWSEQARLGAGEKNRADHRHHAIDAVVIALTDRSRLQQLAKLRREGGTAATGEVLPEPWAKFRDSVVARMTAMNVSHRVRRKVAGALHEDMLYGKSREAGTFVVRKFVSELSANEIELIRDPAIRRIVTEAVSKAGLKTGARNAARKRTARRERR